jgi:hypothetical protein
MLTAQTKDVVFSPEVLGDVLAQLALGDLRQNAVGIITWGYEFVESGMVRELCAHLPFETVGVTTLSSARHGDYGLDILIVSVLTSDEAKFTTMLSDPLTKDNVVAGIKESCRQGLAKAGESPSLILSYLPLFFDICNSVINEAMEEVYGGIPIFGTGACDATVDYHESYVLYNGVAVRDQAAHILLTGAVEAEFFVGNVDQVEEMHSPKGIITAAEGNVLMTINNMPFFDYLQSIGMQTDFMKSMKAVPIPFIINYNDGAGGLARTLFFMDEENNAVFSGDMPVGGSIAVFKLDHDGVLSTTASLIREVEKVEASCFLIYSCVLRDILLGVHSDDEILKFEELLSKDVPYHFAYSGGEICPLRSGDSLINHTHNFSLIICALR